MIQQQAFLPRLLSEKQSSWAYNLPSIALGVIAMARLAQFSIPLPFTPVPITGQTFGVAMIGLLWGWKRALATTVSYLLVGALGFPVFALGKAGLAMGPTAGYLFGMVIASAWMGFLADHGWTKTFLRTWLAATSGSLIIFSCGLFVLSFFVPEGTLLAAGLFPFIPGDLLKTFLVANLVTQTNKTI